ncbi:MAG TPA: nuclear transport factor 2 family protein [Mycobacteriales bacterium]|nr:nuclear transport factor 2 family protein [Mycobacteriales bacterium]
MTDFAAIVEEYIATWNDTDATSRRQRIERSWAADASYTDPLVAAEGHEQIDQTIGAVQAQFPGFRFHLVGPVDGHHEQVRFTWGLGPDGGESLVVGSDVALLGPNGALQQVFGFLDKVPAA